MGNLLKAGKDYGDTFSSTVSGDGLRWFCSLAAACNKRIRGWDATTGYLQTKQRIKTNTLNLLVVQIISNASDQNVKAKICSASKYVHPRREI